MDYRTQLWLWCGESDYRIMHSHGERIFDISQQSYKHEYSDNQGLGFRGSWASLGQTNLWTVKSLMDKGYT